MSFSILRTNVGLTTNIKIVVDSLYNLSLSSIKSIDELSNSKFGKIPFIKSNTFDYLIPSFYDGLPAEIAFYIKYDNDIDTTSNDYSSQYDELYQYGARNIINNKEYNEEFEYFAPLYITPNNLPKKFIIFRVDGSGIESIDKSNVKSKIFKNFKSVKIFDLTNQSPIGEWLDINFNNNKSFPVSPFEMSFQNLEFSNWNGIDYRTGGYTSISLFLESIYEEEKEIFEMEKFIFDGYKNNQVVFPNILNMSFLFDDTPADSESLKKWSINRYYGFYFDDMILVKTISPYKTTNLRSDIIIQSGNVLYSPTGNPFINGYSSVNIYYIEYNGEYYNVEQFTENSGVELNQITNNNVVTQEYSTKTIIKYRIISDVDLSGKESFINKNSGIIGDDSTYPNRLLNYDGTNFIIDDFDSADIWIIEIDGIFHNIVKETGPEVINGIKTVTTRIRINTDYSFSFGNNSYKYWINKSDASYTKEVNFLVDKNNSPKKFKIYKLKFTDLKDFDDRIVDTEYSKYEYEKKSEITQTDETKMYLTNLFSNSNPKDYDDFIYKERVVNIPVSSEYTANYETFKIDKNELSEIWRKNSVYCRWAFQNSLSSNDYPYLLNNSLIFEDYNRTSNPFNFNPQRIERNLDYFYTINSSSSSYIHHTLHVENNKLDGSIDKNFNFELDKYLNIGTYDFDYFSYFFNRKTSFDDGNIKKNVKKYSIFNTGDISVPNISLFRGIKFLIYDVEDVKINNAGDIGVINLRNSNQFENYKMSILLSNNSWSVTNTTGNYATISSISNTMSWNIIDNWKMDKSYSIGDIVIMDDILYQSSIDANITLNPEYSLISKSKSAPYNQPNWSYYTPSQHSIFWNPSGIYPGSGIGTGNDVVYNGGDYYYFNSSGNDNFWNPGIGYNINDVILFNGQFFISMTSSNKYRPDFKSKFTSNGTYSYYWSLTQSTSPKWIKVELWNPSVSYILPSYVIHNDTLYYTPNGSQTGNDPGIYIDWKFEYSMIPDNTKPYDININPIIFINDSYYLINSNISKSTLNNGINIYINKRWKNILFNISISDNTVPNISESDRDDLYNEINNKLTAHNFIQSINNLSNKYGFTEYLNYIIIDEDNTIRKYNYDSLGGIPYYIICEEPDEVKMKYNSLLFNPINLPKTLKPLKILKIVDALSNINNYNGVPIAAQIYPNNNTPKPITNYHGGKNITEDIIYRYSGYYMPVFYDIQLFSKNCFTSSVGNYIFDTDLSEFGIVKERKIRKINHKGSILKLDNIKDQKSIYPMLDEFGYTVVDFFIFKSTWDIKYHYITNINSNTIISSIDIISNMIDVGVQSLNKNINL